MATFANIIIADAGAVARTFVGRLNLGLSQTWRYLKDATAINDRVITQRFSPAKQPDGDHKVSLTIEVPLVDAPAPGSGYTPAPRIVKTTKFQVLGFLPARCTTLDRQDAHAFLVAALQNAQIKDLFIDFSPPRN